MITHKIKLNFFVPSILFFTILLFTSLSSALNIIPRPQNISNGNSYWNIPSSSIICFNPEAKPSALKLKKLVSNFSHALLNEKKTCSHESWQISTNPKLNHLGPEGYTLNINSKGVIIKAPNQAGLFYAIQTLRQLLPASSEVNKKNYFQKLPIVNIEDWPRFAWRGSMLDIARNFFNKEYIKKHIDRMALFKLNRLHLHLTDDQGWRIEIKKYPNLTRHGGSGSVFAGRSGYLSQSDYIDIQKYALKRNIIIIPEIDMPGHTYSALASYPELNCDDLSNLTPARKTPPNLYSGYRVKWTSLCLSKPFSYEFAKDVLTEIANITMGPWVHIGGDEVENTQYTDFILFAEKTVMDLNKTTIGWQEILKAKVNKSTIAQVWFEKVKDSSVKKIISLCKYFYLDHGNSKKQIVANNWCKKGGITLDDVYRFTLANDKNVLGIEAPVWSEVVIRDRIADRRLWPRLTAVSEVSWTLEKSKEINDFKKRLGYFGTRFNLMGLKYYKAKGVRWSK